MINALVVEHAGARYRGVAMGVLQCGYPLGWLLASLGAAPLLASHGWRAACLLAFLVVPLVLPLAWLLRRYGVDHRAVVVSEGAAIAPPGGLRIGARSAWGSRCFRWSCRWRWVRSVGRWG